MKKIDFVLPLAVKSYRQEPELRRFKHLLTSLCRFLDPGILRKFWILVQPAGVRAVKEFVKDYDLPITVLDEREILFSVNHIHGYQLQQIIKLAMGLFTEEFYLTLDADILLVDNLTIDVLLKETDTGIKAIFDEFPKSPSFYYWWQNSAEILQTDPRLLSIGSGVTPQMLSQKIIYGLKDKLESLYNKPWLNTLSSHYTWSEYSIYDLFARDAGLLYKYHVHGNCKAPSAWEKHHIDTFKPPWLFGGHFSVIQTCHISYTDLTNMLVTME